jgi:hypothetical protein
MSAQQRTGGEGGWVGELIDSTRGVAGADPHTEFSTRSNSGCYERSRSRDSGGKMPFAHRVEALIDRLCGFEVWLESRLGQF